MEDYKEFTGKSLDEAMAAACSYFGLERGKLEIEILSDAKSGIFGLVGAKRAAVRARKANIETLGLKVGEDKNKSEVKNRDEKQPQAKKPRPPKAPKAEAPAEKPAPAPAPVTESAPAPAPKAAAAAEKPRERNGASGEKRPNDKNRGKAKGEKPVRPPRHERPKQPRTDKPAPPAEGSEEKFPEVALDNLDQAMLEAEVLNAVDSMTRHIVGETGKEFEISGGKVRVRIDSGEDSGLLIGRDGQTLAALQYLASCIVSRRMGALVRVQIDAGDYRNRQLEKLRSMALEMAAKVKETSRPQSTRPMSAYLRRVVHMALQEDAEVQTHSKGEGSLKRVVIVPKKK